MGIDPKRSGLSKPIKRGIWHITDGCVRLACEFSRYEGQRRTTLPTITSRGRDAGARAIWISASRRAIRIQMAAVAISSVSANESRNPKSVACGELIRATPNIARPRLIRRQ